MKTLKKLLICVAFLIVVIYFFIPKEAKKPTNATTVEECNLIFDDPKLNEQITAASRILMNNTGFCDYLWKNVHPYNGSFTKMEELKNDQFFTQQEQNAMIEAFSLLKGVTCIENHEDYIEFILRLENGDVMTLYYLPPAGNDAESKDKYKTNIRYLSQFAELITIDDNWCMSIWKAPN